MKRNSKRDGGRSAWQTVFELTAEFRVDYFCLLVASSLLSAMEGVLHPLLVKAIFDDIAFQRGMRRFVILIVSYLALGLFLNAGVAGAALWAKRLENRIVRSVGGRLLKSYYEGDFASILQNGYGYYIGRVHGDVRDGVVPLLALLQSMINDAVLLLSLSIVLVYLSWKAFSFLAVLIPLAAIVSVRLGRKLKVLTTQEREQEGILLSVLTKALAAFRIVRTFHLLPKTRQAFDDRMAGYLDTTYQRHKITQLFASLNNTVMVVADFCSMLVGALFVLKGTLTFGAYLAFVNSFWRAVTTLTQLFNRAPEVHSLITITRRISSFLSSAAPAYYDKGELPAVEGITFHYNDGPTVLEDFSLHLRPKERIVIVGANGSGKTTLANILAGTLAPRQGKVTLPERISSITLPIAFPPVQIKDLVNDAGMLTVLGLWNGTNLEGFADDLSAGQQQKLALIMALSRDADLYLFDEPLANLDAESKVAAINLILERTRGKCLILVMHGSEEYHGLFDRVVKIDSAASFNPNHERCVPVLVGEGVTDCSESGEVE